MGEGQKRAEPFWLTRLAVVLFAWVILALCTILASSRLFERLSDLPLNVIAYGVYLVPAVLLLGWSLRNAWRKPRTYWPGPILLIAVCTGFVAAAQPLFDVGVALNFASRRAAYDAIVADIRQGRWGKARGPDGWVRASHGGIRFSFAQERPDIIWFSWSRSTVQLIDVVFDAKGCPAPPAPRAPPVDGGPPTISLYSRHLGGHYCYSHAIV